MYKSCPKCGGIHEFGFKCTFGDAERKNGDIGFRYRHKRLYYKMSKTMKALSNYLCAVCLDLGVYNADEVETHHIEKVRNRPDLACDIENLVCLCKRHHVLADKGVISKDYLRKIRIPRV